MSTGCFANAGEYPAKINYRGRDLDVCHNGLVNDLLAIRLPVTGDASLRRYRDGSSREPSVWRVDAESSDGAMSIALGILQMWAETNPQMRFTSICSHAVIPSDAMLCWLSALSNVWVGHTTSPWFSQEALDVRFAAIKRYIAFGIPSVVWITIHPRWDNVKVLQRALELVPPECIIEYHSRASTVRICQFSTSTRGEPAAITVLTRVAAGFMCGGTWRPDEWLPGWQPTATTTISPSTPSMLAAVDANSVAACLRSNTGSAPCSPLVAPVADEPPTALTIKPRGWQLASSPLPHVEDRLNTGRRRPVGALTYS